MLDQNVAHEMIDMALSCGADFCDVFIEKKSRQSVSFNSSQVKDISTGVDFGIGIRLVHGLQSYYGYTNSSKKEDLLKLTNQIAQNLKEGLTRVQELKSFQELSYHNIPFVSGDMASLNEHVNFLRKFDQAQRKEGTFISQVNLGLNQYEQEVFIYNSEGLKAYEKRPYIRLSASVQAEDGEKKVRASHNPGVRGGKDFLSSIDLDQVVSELAQKSYTILHARPCSAGTMTVIIDKGFGGVIFHEACGHLLETTSVEKKASVFWDKKGEMIGQECLTAIDDGTIDHLWGSLSIDDEGEPTQKTTLLKNGKLENFLSDRLGEMKTGHKRTGSGRRQSYRYAPASRMRNTFIAPGESSLEEMISSLDEGIYCKSMGGGSVNPATGEFNFSVEEAYKVEKGKITHALRGATLIGKGEEIIPRISMVGNNLDYSAGMCGSVSGSIPVTVGQPAIKVDEILIGGQA